MKLWSRFHSDDPRDPFPADTGTGLRGRNTKLLAVLLALLALLTSGCSGALAGGTIGKEQPIFVGVPYLTHCASCHGTSQPAREAQLFASEWKERANALTYAAEGSAARMGRLLDAYLAPSHPPHGLSAEDARGIREAIVCHHYPKSAGCRNSR